MTETVPMKSVLTDKQKAQLENKLKKLFKRFGITLSSNNSAVSQVNVGSQVINGVVVGNVAFNDISFENLKSYFEERFKDLGANLHKIEPLILDATRTIFKECHNGLIEMQKSSNLQIDDIKKNQEELAKTLQGKCVQECKEMKEQIITEITSLSRICEEICYNVNLVQKQCEDNNIEIKIVKEMLANYIKAAELKNQELLSAIQVVSKVEEKEILPTHLDTGIIAEMFAAIQNIKKQSESGVKDVSSLITEYNNDIKSQYSEIENNIATMKQIGEDALSKANEILYLAIDTNRMVKNIDSNVEDIKQLLKNLSDQHKEVVICQSKIDDAISNVEIDRLENELKQLQTKFNETLSKLEIATSTGGIAIFACRYCGAIAERKIIKTECVCTVCGHRYHVDPNVKGISDEKIKAEIATPEYASIVNSEKKSIETWRKRHTATLEQVSANVHNGLYRMKLDEYTVSGNGVLIIPNKTHDNKPIKEIDFCQPNTDDKVGQERLKKVRTIILKPGVEIGEYEGKEPFAEIPKIEWDNNCCQKNSTMLKI